MIVFHNRLAYRDEAGRAGGFFICLFGVIRCTLTSEALARFITYSAGTGLPFSSSS
jgi:hypothetical protein